MKTKVELRAEFKEKIALIESDTLVFRSKKLSLNLQRLIADLEVIQKNLELGCFCPIQNEPLWNLGLEEKIHKQTSYPSVIGEEMVFRKSSLAELVMTKKFGADICTPKEECSLIKPDVFLVPGLAFGFNGHRLGRGKGYYDKYFEGFESEIKIGLCFQEQLVPEMLGFKHDVRMNYVVTDHEIYKIKI